MKRVTAFVLTLGLLLGLASGPLAQPTRAASLKICGEVTLFVEPTILASGLLTINAVPLVVAAGVDLPASVDVGADLCLDITTNGAGMVTGASVTANTHAHLKVCGTVTVHAEASPSATGLLKIGGNTFTIGVGSELPASIDVGDNLCVDLELDAFGRVSDGQVSANVVSHVKICGVVTALAEATSTSTGSLTIGGDTFKIAVGENMPAIVDVGADLCLDLTLNGFGQISGTEALLNVDSTLNVCGRVTAYAAATNDSDGSITVGGVSKVIAAGANVDSDVEANIYVKLRLTLDAFGRVSKAKVLKIGASLDDACGTEGPDPTAEPPVEPGPTDGPDATDDPDPSASSDPSVAPGPSSAPDPSEPPFLGVDDDLDTCDDDVAGAAGDGGSGGTLLPDTNALGRAAGVVAMNAIPLIAIGLLGALAAWYRSRRNEQGEGPR
jgi:hypothetical protein